MTDAELYHRIYILWIVGEITMVVLYALTCIMVMVITEKGTWKDEHVHQLNQVPVVRNGEEGAPSAQEQSTPPDGEMSSEEEDRCLTET